MPLISDLSGWYSEITLDEIGYLGAQDGRQAEERTTLFVDYREQVESIARDKYEAGEWDGKAVLVNNNDI
jgi:hypothetical protein